MSSESEQISHARIPGRHGRNTTCTGAWSANCSIISASTCHAACSRNQSKVAEASNMGAWRLPNNLPSAHSSAGTAVYPPQPVAEVPV